MEKLGIKESLKSYPVTSHSLATTHDPSGKTRVQSAVFFLFTAWHVIILCLCMKSCPLSKEKPVSEGQMPTHDVVTTEMLCKEVRKQTRLELQGWGILPRKI